MIVIMNKPNQYLPHLAYAAICIIWGTTYLAASIALKAGFSPFILGTIRFLIAGMLLLAAGLISRKLEFNSSSILKNLTLGIIMMGGGQGLIFWAQQYISSGYAATLEASLPLWFVILDKQNRKSYFQNKLVIMGLLLGFIGVVLLFLKQINNLSSMTFIQSIYGSTAIILSCICWVGPSLYYSRNFKKSALLNDLCWQIFGGMLCCIAVSSLTGEWIKFNVSNLSSNGWLGVIYLALAGSIGAFVSYHWLLRQWPAARVGTYAYINPLIAVVLGYFVLSESINFYQLIGMVFILVAAFIVNKYKAELSK